MRAKNIQPFHEYIVINTCITQEKKYNYVIFCGMKYIVIQQYRDNQTIFKQSRQQAYIILIQISTVYTNLIEYMEPGNNLTIKYAGLMAQTGCLLTLFFPLDMVRTRLQSSPELLKRQRIKTQYKGAIDCFKRILQQQKWTAFWKGNGSNLIRFYLSETANFTSKQIVQTKIKNTLAFSSQTMSSLFITNFISGAAGSCLTLAFIYPFDFCRQRLNNDLQGKNTIRSILRDVYRTQGIKGIYKGSVNFFIVGAIFRSFYFGIFDTIKNIEPNNILMKAFGGYIAAITAIYIVYPFDTLRKRIIMAAGTQNAYKNLRDASQKIWKNQGFFAFYKASSIVLIQGFALTAILCFYDQLGKDFRKLKSMNTMQQIL